MSRFTTCPAAQRMFFLTVWVVLCFGVTTARQVEVDIQANWPKYSTNLITEIGEYLFEQHDLSSSIDSSGATHNKLYWNYSNRLCAHSNLIDSIVNISSTSSSIPVDLESELNVIAYQVAQELVPNGLHHLVQHLVSVGEYTPTVRFHQLLSQQYDEINPCPSNTFALLLPQREFICSAENIRSTVQSLSHRSDESIVTYAGQREYDELFDATSWDHQYRPMMITGVSEETASLPYLILYGTLGSSSLCHFLSEATALVDSSLIEGFSLRSSFHALTPVASTTALQGYGVYLDIKNMEYHNFDDEDNAKKENSALTSTEELAKLNPEEEILGINVYKLSKKFAKHKDNYPTSHYTTLRRQLVFANSTTASDKQDDVSAAGATGSTEMKIWKLKDLGLQLVQSFQTLYEQAQNDHEQSDSSSSQPFRETIEKVTEYIWNFPMYASVLSSAKVSASLRDEVNGLYTMTPLTQVLPSNTLFIRGKSIRLDSNTFNYFDALQKLHNEYKHLLQVNTWLTAVNSAWSRLQIPSQFPEIMEHVASYEEFPDGQGLYYTHSPGAEASSANDWEKEWHLHAAQKDDMSFDEASDAMNPWASLMPGRGGGGGDSKEATYRVDISKGSKHAVIFLNNLEKDPQYRSWSKSLQALFYPSWSLPQLRRNLYTILIVVDFLSKDGIFMYSQVQMMMQQMYPLRFGFVPTCFAGSQTTDDGTIDHELFCFLFATLKEEFSLPVALEFLSAWSEHYMQLTHPHYASDASEADQELGRQYRRGKIPLLKVLEVYEATLKRNGKKLPYTKRDPFILKLHEYLHDKHTQTASTGSNKWQAAYDFVSNTTAYLAQRGLPVNSYSLNGQIVQETSFQSQAFMSSLGAEQQHFQQLVHAGKIVDSSKSLFSDLLSEGSKEGLFTVYTKYHRLLQDEQGGGKKRYLRYLPTIDTNPVHLAGNKLIQQLTEEGQWIMPIMKPSRQEASTDSTAASLYHSSEDVKTGHTLIVAVPFFTSSGIWQRDSLVAAQKVLEFVLEKSEENRVIRVAFLPTAIPFPDTENIPNTCKSNEDSVSGKCVESVNNNAQMHVQLLLSLLPSYYTQHTSAGTCNLECIQMLRHLYTEILNSDLSVVTVDRVISIMMEFPAARGIIEPFQSLFASTQSLNQAIAKHTATVNALSTSPFVVKADDQITVIFNGRIVQFDNHVDEITSDLTLLRDLELKSHRKYLSDLMVLIDSLPTTGSSHTMKIKEHNDVFTSKSNYLLFLLSYMHHQEELLKGTEGSTTAGGNNAPLSLQKMWKVCESTLGHAFPNLRYTLTPSIPTGWEASAMEIVFVLDPLSLGGQRGMKLLDTFLHTLHLPVTLFFLPKDSYTEFPLKSFYRYVLPTSPATTAIVTGDEDNEGSELKGVGLGGWFDDLPRHHVLTTRVDVPEMWNVQHYRAQQDSDNLRCSRHACGDPILTANLSEHTKIEFILKNVLVAGQCFQATEDELLASWMPGATAASGGRPQYMFNAVPNGLQLVLSPQLHIPSTSLVPLGSSTGGSDTIVMQNLGYYQLLAEIGVFDLSLVSGSRSQALYQLYTGVNGDVEGGNVEEIRESQRVVIKHFHDEIRVLVAVKRKEYESYVLLDDTPLPGVDSTTSSAVTSGNHKEEGEYAPRRGRGKKSANAAKKTDSNSMGGIWNTITNSLFGSPAASPTTATPSSAQSNTADNAVRRVYTEADTIHVFSLATGQLYERLLRIMMLSVIKHTSYPVTFWLFENYLSSHFKQTIPLLTALYGFKVRYVTYKWPQWLLPQTQQQRIIWGYKILFLDVLFPQTLPRVIYIDSDQVIRQDIHDLWTLDLQGAAYAYPPFCTSRQEMVGFQFWRTGYWKEHLQEKPYHISALYVVDLDTFRRHSVGDQLRAIYNQLARDPNSLANLDQDLPNYAQWQIPIYTLPVEWLWCETWCSEESKPYAKTIDLCNNPLNKEPKLDMARRIISGELFDQSWIQLDEEIKAVISQGTNATSSTNNSA